jgi:uncharacterized protein with ParB-like and HNH nuclease domain
MGFQVPITISDAIKRIRERRLLLPAIQREFVWSHSKVEWLFDSLLQDYPIGSFLFWEVRDAQSKADYKYYEFLRDFRERYRTENPEFNTLGHMDFDAVLDGQQRLTALYIGLSGTYAYYKGRVWRQDNEHAVPTRRLYLNILGKAPEDDEQAGRVFEFKFLTDEERSEAPDKWFQVGRILELAEIHRFNKMLIAEKFQDNEFATEALSKLQAVVHSRQLINYYRIEDSDMERALNVFVRVNSAEPLSLSDMLMSTAIAHWKNKDARKVIPELIQNIREKGFFIDKDFVLKACLYLYSSDIRYRVSNFTAARVKPFEDNWDAIRDSIQAAFNLARDFGHTDTSLTSKNTLLPVVYWVHHKKIADVVTSRVGLRPDRDIMRAWVHTMLLKGIIGAGSADTVLAAIRRAFVGESSFGDSYLATGLETFPAVAIAHILRTQGKDPQITDEFIDALLFTQKDARQAFTVLALLAPHLDYKNGNFHKDHLHPETAFGRRKLASAGVGPDDIEFYADPKNWNSILNLAHLDANENKSGSVEFRMGNWRILRSEAL